MDDFVIGLLSFPSEMDIVTEAVHSVSQTLDSRHFAEEFIRRRKLADKGGVDSSASAASGSTTATEARSGGGWSEVAKKGPGAPTGPTGKDDGSVGNFKVVAAKKKGSRRGMFLS